jgi:hypothetical protein
MSEKNRLGLTRYIPADVGREVRRRCGFGCVVCGQAIIDYEHFNPEFKDASFHDPAGIILLCPLHHRAKGGFISREKIAAAAKNPYCISNGKSWTEFDLDDAHVVVGPFSADHCPTVLTLNGDRTIWFNPPEEDGAPIRLNLRLCGPDDTEIVNIKNNVWNATTSSDDIVLVSGELTGRIRVDYKGHTIFQACITPPRHIEISKYIGWSGGVCFNLMHNGGQGEYVRSGRPAFKGSMHSSHCVSAASLS